MSTKAIRKALERLATLEDGSTPEVLQALLEVERIEKAAKEFSDIAQGMSAKSQDLLEQIAKDAP